MDREMLAAHLAMAERHVRLGEKHIGRQMGIIARLEKRGYDASEVWALMWRLEELQQLHVAHRDRLKRELQ
jgi:hypothetical protein